MNLSLLCPLCLFSQFYTKIDFLENFATEPFNEICDIIDDYDLANMRELRNFVKYHGAEYGLPSMKVIRSLYDQL